MNETIKEHIFKSIDVSAIMPDIIFCFENANNNMRLENSKKIEIRNFNNHFQHRQIKIKSPNLSLFKFKINITINS